VLDSDKQTLFFGLGLDASGQQNVRDTNATNGAGLHAQSGSEATLSSRLFSNLSFGNASDVDPYLQKNWRVDSNRGTYHTRPAEQGN
jgi:hypothetical protein